jgi:mannose-P-dolichol utilization defect protein 1
MSAINDPAALDVSALLQLASRILSTFIVVGSCAFKLPQIYNMLRSGDARGVSLASTVVEGLGFAIAAAWGYVRELPFTAYGEALTILAQITVLCALIGGFTGGRTALLATAGVALIAVVGWALATRLVPPEVHEGLMGVQMAFVLASRVPQIMMNHRNRATGVLSFLTFFIGFGGAGVRVVTNAISVPWEKGKLVMVCTSVLSCALNAVICMQIHVYGPKFKEERAAEKTAARASSLAETDKRK